MMLSGSVRLSNLTQNSNELWNIGIVVYKRTLKSNSSEQGQTQRCTNVIVIIVS